MIIRYGTEKDLPAIVEIYNAAVPTRMATADLEPVSIESRKSWFRGRTPSHFPLWVIETDGIIGGWLSFQSFYNRPAYHATAEISIYISPNFQRQGLGKKLLQEAIIQCPNLGIKNLISLIFAHNEPSLKLFSSFGFQHWGLFPKVADLDGVERDLIILGLNLIDN